MCGTWDVDGLLEQIPPEKLNDWIAYYELEPWGEERGDLQAAIISTTMAGLWSTGKNEVADFMPDFTGERKPKQTARKLRQKLLMFAAAFGCRLSPADAEACAKAERSGGRGGDDAPRPTRTLN